MFTVRYSHNGGWWRFDIMRGGDVIVPDVKDTLLPESVYAAEVKANELRDEMNEQAAPRPLAVTA
jgi:hypothetical protein